MRDMILVERRYDHLYLELKRAVQALGIEVSDDWERRVCFGERNIPLLQEAREEKEDD